MPIRLLTSGGGTTTIQPTTSASSVTLTVPSVNANVVTTGDTASVTQAMLGTGVAATGPAFSAYRSSSQSITGGAYTKVQFDTEQFDTASCYDTTLYRFTPNVAGYYQFLSTVDLGAVNNRYTATLYKNGSASIQGINIVGNGVNSQGATLSCIAYANGSTDYFEMYVQGNNSATLGGGTAPIYSYFQAFMIRAS